jgi:hypothetical protein
VCRRRPALKIGDVVISTRYLTTMALTGAAIFSLAVRGLCQSEQPEEPPLVGQPAHFSGAVGTFTISTHAEPISLQAEDPLVFTVTIRSVGAALQPPRRPRLQGLPEFGRLFVVEDIADMSTPKPPGVWEFRYRLRPRNAEVKQIPEMRLDYYKPGIIPRQKGYRVAYAEPISLAVSPRTEVPSTAIHGASEGPSVPERLYELASGPARVLRRQELGTMPSLLVSLVVIGGAPAVCAGWYVWWRRRYPGAARQIRQRHSRAARQALLALEAASQRDADPSADPATAIVGEYLRQRWDLITAEPTPPEVAALLKQHGCPNSCAAEAAVFFRMSDIARYGPVPAPERNGLTTSAIRLVRALEDHACSARMS